MENIRMAPEGLLILDQTLLPGFTDIPETRSLLSRNEQPRSL